MRKNGTAVVLTVWIVVIFATLVALRPVANEFGAAVGQILSRDK